MANKPRSGIMASNGPPGSVARTVCQQAALFAAECRKTGDEDQGLLAACLLGGGTPLRRLERMQPSEVAHLLGRSEVWIRVNVLLVRRRFPCSSSAACGREHRACADWRGERVLCAIRLKALNAFLSK